ncbi:hypothetical protein Pfo_026421 [Paulownia fortunei]|nr:hypothetical protein Pfo_026421 [Paulownia fortunei]
MVWHKGKNMATLFLMLLFGAMAFTNPSQADFHLYEEAPKSEHEEKTVLVAEQMSQQLLRWPWSKSPPPRPGVPHLPPAPPGGKPSRPSWKPWGRRKPPPSPGGKPPWWKPWGRRKPPPSPGGKPSSPWWKPWGRRKSPPPPF